MFTDKTFTGLKNVNSTEANLLESVKKVGKSGLRKTRHFFTTSKEAKFWNNLPDVLESKFNSAFSADTALHKTHVQDMEDEILAEINTFKSAKSAYEDAQKVYDAQKGKTDTLTASSDDSEKHKKEKRKAEKREANLGKTLNNSKNKFDAAKRKLEVIKTQNFLQRAELMFDETVDLGDKAAETTLNEIKSKLEEISTTFMATQRLARETAKTEATGAIQQMLTEVDQLLQ